jgi:hypothetical protein
VNAKTSLAINPGAEQLLSAARLKAGEKKMERFLMLPIYELSGKVYTFVSCMLFATLSHDLSWLPNCFLRFYLRSVPVINFFASRKAVHFSFTITHAHQFSKYSHAKLYTFCTSWHFLNCPLGFFNRIKFIDTVIAACHIVVLEKYANRDVQVSWTMTIRRWLMR